MKSVGRAVVATAVCLVVSVLVVLVLALSPGEPNDIARVYVGTLGDRQAEVALLVDRLAEPSLPREEVLRVYETLCKVAEEMARSPNLTASEAGDLNQKLVTSGIEIAMETVGREDWSAALVAFEMVVKAIDRDGSRGALTSMEDRVVEAYAMTLAHAALAGLRPREVLSAQFQELTLRVVRQVTAENSLETHRLTLAAERRGLATGGADAAVAEEMTCLALLAEGADGVSSVPMELMSGALARSFVLYREAVKALPASDVRRATLVCWTVSTWLAVGSRAAEASDWSTALVAFDAATQQVDQDGARVPELAGLLDAAYYRSYAMALAGGASSGETAVSELEKQLNMLARRALTTEKSLLGAEREGLAASVERVSVEVGVTAAREVAALVLLTQGTEAVVVTPAEALSGAFNRSLVLCREALKVLPLTDTRRSALARWVVSVGVAVGSRAAEASDWSTALVAFDAATQQVDQDGARVPELAGLLDAAYYRSYAMALAGGASSGETAVSDFEVRLAALTNRSLRTVGKAPVDEEARKRLLAVRQGLETGGAPLSGCVAALVSREVGFIALVLGERLQTEANASRWALCSSVGGGQEAYTLLELQDHPEIARFTVSGHGSYREMEVHFTYVAREIDVIVTPVVFFYTGSRGYQSMATYRLERWVITGPTVKVVPALCTDFDAATPSAGASDYVVRQLVHSGEPDSAALVRRLYALESVELTIARLRTLGVRGRWDATTGLPEEFWERARAVLVWSVTNPERWPTESVGRDLASTLLRIRIADAILGRLPTAGVDAETRRSVADALARLYAEGDDWESTWTSVMAYVRSNIGSWQTQKDLSEAIMEVVESAPSSTGDSIRSYGVLVLCELHRARYGIPQLVSVGLASLRTEEMREWIVEAALSAAAETRSALEWLDAAGFKLSLQEVGGAE